MVPGIEILGGGVGVNVGWKWNPLMVTAGGTPLVQRVSLTQPVYPTGGIRTLGERETVIGLKKISM